MEGPVVCVCVEVKKREAGREGVMGEGFEGRKPAHSPYQQTLTFVLSILDKI
jgi:hypothetical protein